MNLNLEDPIQYYQKYIHYWILSEVERISDLFGNLSQNFDSYYLLNQTSLLNNHPLLTNQSSPFMLEGSSNNNQLNEKESDSLKGDENNMGDQSEGNNITPETIQQNRLKSNYKKKIAIGRICTVKCINESEITKGYMVVFKYYSIKLTFGPFLHLKVAQIVRSDFREKLFKLKITKFNYQTVIHSYYREFKCEMETKYKELAIYHKAK